MNRPILLSPAGSYESFSGALNAGADAVYLGGDRFSARAYADNFSSDEVCRAITEAHFYGKRVYLTLNTLMKDDEISDAVSYIRPMYEAGLDAVIIQDLGILSKVREIYPDLEIHASTQMTIAGEEGALWMKDKGIDCIVPSRELSLNEIKRIKEKTGMKIECFIHGAMCYCYSGQCLMSSMLGDRSGNRGRCAQPCRQMYDTVIDGEDPEKLRTTDYPLSMRDMCTIEILPSLIESGIDLFKIEGRMKSPEYSAGVTAIYRKYIDRYFEKGAAAYSVDPDDMNTLRHLYVRNQLQDGYYNRPNGADMISGDKPGYSGNDENITAMIRQKYLGGSTKKSLSAEVTLKTDMPAEMVLSDGQVKGHASAGVVQKALKAPLSEDLFKERISKTGGTVVDIPVQNISLTADEGIFMPNGMINELRRAAIDDYVKNKISSYGKYRSSSAYSNIENSESVADNLSENKRSSQNNRVDETVKTSKETHKSSMKISISVMTAEQLEAAVRSSCDNIIIDSDMYLSDYDYVRELISSKKAGRHDYYIVLPYIFRSSRNSDRNFMNDLTELAFEDDMIKGFLFRNLDELHFIEKIKADGKNKMLIADAGFYTFNSAAADFISGEVSGFTYPYELTDHEIKMMADNLKGSVNTKANADKAVGGELIVYSTIPMMITSNCIRKTAGKCLHGHGDGRDLEDILNIKTGIRDRKGIRFSVYTNCDHCYNVIFNSVPMNLSGHIKEIKMTGASSLRLEFVYENSSEVTRIISAFDEALKSGRLPDGYRLRPNAYTTGHFIHGIQ